MAASSAFAQSSVTLSGGINVGVVDTGAAGSKPAVASLGGGANAVNIESAEDLGSGLKGGFTSQIRYSAATGDVGSSGTGNALFHAANVYVGGGFGTVRVGKIAEASACAFDPWGCTGGASMIAGDGTTVGAAGKGLVGALTQAQSVSYTSPTIAGFSGSYQSTFAARGYERQVLNLSYANGPVAAQILRTENTSNTGANGAGGAAYTTPTDAKGNATSIAASYNFGVAKLNAYNAVTKDAAGAKTYDITSISASAPFGAYTVLAGYAKDKKQAATADTKLSVGVNYALSKRTTLGADLFKQESVGASTGFVIRAGHTF